MELAGLWASTTRVPEPASTETPALVRSFEAMARFHSFLDRAFVRRVQLVCSPVGRLLDVGTGPGFVPILLKRQMPHLKVVGVDLSEEMIRRARKNARRAGLYRGIDFVVGDACQLPFRAGAFDCVVSFHTLHHIPEPGQALREFRRATRRSGSVYVSDLRRPEHRLSMLLFQQGLAQMYLLVHPGPDQAIRQYRQSLQAAYDREEWHGLFEGVSAGEEDWCSTGAINHEMFFAVR